MQPGVQPVECRSEYLRSVVIASRKVGKCLLHAGRGSIGDPEEIHVRQVSMMLVQPFFYLLLNVCSSSGGKLRSTIWGLGARHTTMPSGKTLPRIVDVDAVS